MPNEEADSPASPFLTYPAFATTEVAGSTHAACTFSSDGLKLLFRRFAFDRVAYVEVLRMMKD